MKINGWGVASFALCGIAFTVQPIGARLLHDGANLWLALYTLLQISALTCSIVAAVRGSKGWFLMSLVTALLIVQAILALLVE